MNLLNEEQKKQFQEIGAYFRQVREEKSILLEEIATKTLIREIFLHALEEGRAEDLPEPIYVQGFIRRYGDVLGLDGMALSQNFATAFKQPEPEINFPELEKKTNFYIPLYVPYILLLIVACFGLFYVLNPPGKVESITQKNNSTTVKEKKVPLAKPSSSSVGQKPSSQLPSPTTAAPKTQLISGVEVSLELQDESWMRVKADGKTVFEGTLKKGERKTWKAEKQLFIRAGNAGAVLISANQKPPTLLGNIGQIREVSFTKETQ